MTLDYYVGEIRILIKQVQDDSKIDDRLIIRWINTQRAVWIKNQVNNEYVLSDSVIQTIENVRLEPLKRTKEAFIKTTDRYLVSEELPKFIEFKDRLGIIAARIDSLSGYALNIIDNSAIKYSNHGRFNKADIYATLYNKKLYIKIPKHNFKVAMLTDVTIDGVFENPLNLTMYSKKDGTRCFNKDTEDYPISDALWEFMQGNIINAKYGTLIRMPEPVANDNNDKS